MMSFSRLLFAAIVAGATLTAPGAGAQAWPEKPIKFIVPAPAGSSLDVLARVIGDKLKDRLGQPIVVDDRPGAGGTLATDLVAKSAPDGYTMVISFNGPLSFGPHLYSKLPYDPQKDLAPVIITSSQPNVLAINAALPIHSVKELVAYAKANPGKLNYASVGNGSSSHLTMELLKSEAGIDIVHVPFNGSPPAVTATIQGETQMMFAVMPPLQAQIQAGKLRALAVTTAKRFALQSRDSDDCRSRLPRFRGAGVERSPGRRGDAGGDRAAPEHRDQRDPQGSGGQVEAQLRRASS